MSNTPPPKFSYGYPTCRRYRLVINYFQLRVISLLSVLSPFLSSFNLLILEYKKNEIQMGLEIRRGKCVEDGKERIESILKLNNTFYVIKYYYLILKN